MKENQTKKLDFPIDFTLMWVDSSDKQWLKEFNKYAPKEKQKDIDISIQRYRDYGLLKYWFRAVEAFAPWVNKIYFITSGQKPDFLNVNSPKLVWVKHSDYLPLECLPVFSARPIELFLHKIKDLSEHFVFFNDDFFLTAPVTKDFFFKNGLPCDAAVQNIAFTDGHSVMHSTVLNDLYEINKNFCKKDVIKQNFFKWYNIKYGKDNAKNFVLSLWKKYVGFINPHFPQPYLKSCLEDCQKHCQAIFKRTLHSRFRSETDVNQWLFRYWHLCCGKFSPITPYKDKKYFQLGQDATSNICRAVEKQTYKTICINDGDDKDFEKSRDMLQKSFDMILPNKSSFEI